MVVKNKVKVCCFECSKEFEKIPSKLTKRNYCSNACRKTQPTHITCPCCENSIKRISYKQKYCSTKCQMDYEYSTGKRDKKTIALKANQTLRDRTIERWKNGTMKSYISKRGYRMLYTPWGEVKEHHYVWNNESDWGFIPDGFVVHHINNDKLDNRIENLACIPEDIHLQLHYAQREKDELGRMV